MSKLSPETKAKVDAEIDKLLQEKKYSEAAELIVAAAIANTDPEELAKGLMEAVDKVLKEKRLNTHG